MNDREAPEWVVILGTLVVLGLLVSLGLIAAGGWEWFAKFLEGSAASWAQAVGGVAAVFAAFEVGRAQVRAGRALEQTKRAADETHRLVVIHALALSLHGTLSDLRTILKKWDMPIMFSTFPPRILRDLVALEKVQLLDCPSTRIIYALTTLPDSVRSTLESMKSFEEAFDAYDQNDRQRKSGVLWNGLTVDLTYIDLIISEAQKEIEARKRLLGDDLVVMEIATFRARVFDSEDDGAVKGARKPE